MLQDFHASERKSAIVNSIYILLVSVAKLLEINRLDRIISYPVLAVVVRLIPSKQLALRSTSLDLHEVSNSQREG